jgi:hypothetical protein
MLPVKPLLLLSLFLVISCEDKVVQNDPNDRIITPVTEEKCDSTTVYNGISSISEVTDTTVKISWNLDLESIGYILFQEDNGALKIIKKLSTTDSEFTVSALAAESNYRFLLRSINKSGNFDCNENYQDIQTTEKQIFISCNDIHTHYQGVKPSGVYEIDPDITGPNAPYDVYCDMDNNGGGWTRVLNHDSTTGVFANKTQAAENNITDPTDLKYSILSKLSEFKKNGKFNFWIYYPALDGIDGGNLWTQTSNPLTETTVTDYIAVRETYSDKYWGGLGKSTSSGTLIDGSTNSWWYYAIGATSYWPNGQTIPGPGPSVDKVQLFIK